MTQIGRICTDFFCHDYGTQMIRIFMIFLLRPRSPCNRKELAADSLIIKICESVALSYSCDARGHPYVPVQTEKIRANPSNSPSECTGQDVIRVPKYSIRRSRRIIKTPDLDGIEILYYICKGQRISEGNGNVPFSFIAMASETHIQTITEMVQALLQGDPDCFLVEIWIKPTNNIRVAIDADGGLAIEKCVSLNRRLYKQIEEAALYTDGNFSLEVSSPGLEEPLKMHRQYVKNISRPVEILLLDGTTTEGVLTAVHEGEIEVAETKGKNKKKEVVQHTIPFSNIKSTKIQIKF